MLSAETAIGVDPVAVVLVMRLVSRPADRKRTTFDIPGLVLFIMFVGPVILALEQLQRMQSSALPLALGLIAFGIFMLARCSGRKRARRRRSSRLACSGTLDLARDGLAACHGAALVSLITFLPIYLRAVRGASPAETGLLPLPLTSGSASAR